MTKFIEFRDDKGQPIAINVGRVLLVAPFPSRPALTNLLLAPELPVTVQGDYHEVLRQLTAATQGVGRGPAG
jgi:hypothetical protein